MKGFGNGRRKALASVSMYAVLSEKCGVGCSVLRRRLSAWQRHGDSGLRKERDTYSAEFKLKAVPKKKAQAVNAFCAHHRLPILLRVSGLPRSTSTTR